MAVETFADSPAAFARADKGARYAHQHWIVWKAGEVFKAARLNEAALKEAVEDVGAGKIYHLAPYAGFHWHNVGPNMAQMWLRNMAAGVFPY